MEIDQPQTNWKTKTLDFLKNNFTKQLIIKRLIFFSIACVLVLPAGIALNLWAQHAPYETYGNNSFLNMHIVANNGVAFSMFANSPVSFVYFVQWFMSLIILAVLLVSRKWYYILLWSCAFLGGVFNVIDRACAKTIVCLGSQIVYNSVIDYFEFNFNWGIFNIPDVFVCIGVFGGVIIYVIETIVNAFKKDDSDQQ